MATFTATANSSSTIGYAQYGSTTWNTGTSNGACQGAYQGDEQQQQPRRRDGF